MLTVATPQHKDNPISPQHSAVEKRLVYQSKGQVEPEDRGHETCVKTPAKPVEITDENKDGKLGDESHETENKNENNTDEKEPTHEKKKKKKDAKQTEIETNDTKEKAVKTSEKKAGEFTESDNEAGSLFKEKCCSSWKAFSILMKNQMTETMPCLFSCVAGGARRTCVHQVGPVEDSGQKGRR